jgi:AAA domain
LSEPRNDYEQFLVWLGNQVVSDDIKRMACGILTHFKEIAKHGHLQSARSRAIVHLISEHFDAINPVQPAAPSNRSESDIEWSRLQRLEVGPFRGFTHHERLELGKRFVLVYGPNGTGKSSFCEALEYTLLGSVNEATEKRIREDEFLANAYQGFTAPLLFATDHTSTEIQVMPDPDALRFGFVEKGRIEEFSRIGALTPGERARSIASLFGVDQFGRFVSDFNELLDIALDLKGKKATELKLKAEAIGADYALLETLPLQAAAFDEQELNLAREFDIAMIFDGLRSYVGTPEHPARLVAVQALLDQPIASKKGLSRDMLAGMRNELAQAGTRLSECTGLLQTRQQDVSYRRLFEAVLELKPISIANCPACDTPLDGSPHVVRNPYDKASQGLSELAQLALLEQERDTAAVGFADVSRALRRTVAMAIEIGQLEGLISKSMMGFVEALPESPNLDSWQVFDSLPFEDGVSWDALTKVAEYCERFDEEIARVTANHAILILERNRLQEFDRKIVACFPTRPGITCRRSPLQRRESSGAANVRGR